MKRRDFLATALASGLTLAAAPALALPEPLPVASGNRWIDNLGRLHIEDETFEQSGRLTLEHRAVYRHCRFIVDEIYINLNAITECVLWIPEKVTGLPGANWIFYDKTHPWAGAITWSLLTYDLYKARTADFLEPWNIEIKKLPDPEGK